MPTFKSRGILMIEIDGSKGEGGGQIIRSALSLASITGKKVRIFNIRAGRSNPGLRPQHMMACNSVRKICRGALEGAEIGSTELVFSPGKIVGGKYEFNIGTAGSTVLVAQTVLPILINAEKKSHVRIIGGTHVIKAPSYDYFEKVFVPAAARFGIKIECRMIRTGFYPKGGGIVEFSVEPAEMQGCCSWKSDDDIAVIIRLAGLEQSIAIREKKIFVQNEIENVQIHDDQSLSVGNAVTCFKGLRGSYVLGEKGKRAEIVAKEALDNLNKETAEVDLHLADQLIIYGALAKGETEYSTSEISNHLRTNIDVVSRFLERKIEIKENKVRIC